MSHDTDESPKKSSKKRSPSSRSKRTAKSGRQSADRRSPTLSWAKWVESLGQNDVVATSERSDDAEIPSTPAGSPPSQETASWLKRATAAARQAREGTPAAQGRPETGTISIRKTTKPAEAGAPRARGAEPLAAARRPDAADAPRARPARVREAQPTPAAPEQQPAAPAVKKRPSKARKTAGRERRGAATMPPATAATLSPPATAEALIQTGKAEPAPTAAPIAAPVQLSDGRLPERYGRDLIEVCARDPSWLFTYWEVGDESWSRARASLGADGDHAQVALRVHVFASASSPDRVEHFDIDIHTPATSWYIDSGRPNRAFEIELGLRAPGGRFAGIVRSRRVATPSDGVSDVLDEAWRTRPEDLEAIYAMSGLGYLRHSSLELGARRMPRWFDIGGSEAVSSFGASEQRLARPKGRRFWFVLGTELMVHGATEPGATVTCQGRPVELRPDGTFTLRFSLPDGRQIIPCTAVSADGIDAITITPRVEKRTTRSERRGTQLAFRAGDRVPEHAPGG